MNKTKPILIYIRRHLEAFIWIAALIALACTSPVEQCSSLCPLSQMGISWCPGCGLGHAISWLFRAEFMHSIEAHPLGIPAVVILLWRIISIFRKNNKYKYINPKQTIQHG